MFPFTKKQPRQYTYIGDDYPLEYPMDSLETIAMTLHETVHYPFNISDPVADLEWATIASNPKGFGRTRLGPDHRLFVVVFYHQLHCLRKLQVALLDRNDPIATPHHAQHCFNYLRQTLLCQAADMLEEGDFMEQDYEVDRVGDTLVCEDWKQAYDVLDNSHEEWLRWREQWN